jgi:GlpG protein
MRQLGTVPDERSAQRFGDFLFTKGISVSIDPTPEGWAVWVRNEDHLDEARREFAAFSADPNAAIYRDAARPAEQLRAEEQRRATQARKNFVNVGQRWRRRGVAGSPVTALLLAASIVVAVLTNLGENPAVNAYVTIDRYVHASDGIRPALLWVRQPWRLVTPIFLHFGKWHILFNMIMLWQLGIPVERTMGSLRYLILVLAIAIPSNFAEYIWDMHRLEQGIIPEFGGMSGVVYGLFGYLWMKSRYDRTSGFMIPSSSVVIMIGWFLLCLTGQMGNVANVVHGAGLAVGIIVGLYSSFSRQLR